MSKAVLNTVGVFDLDTKPYYAVPQDLLLANFGKIIIQNLPCFRSRLRIFRVGLSRYFPKKPYFKNSSQEIAWRHTNDVDLGGLKSTSFVFMYTIPPVQMLFTDSPTFSK